MSIRHATQGRNDPLWMYEVGFEGKTKDSFRDSPTTIKLRDAQVSTTNIIQVLSAVHYPS